MGESLIERDRQLVGGSVAGTDLQLEEMLVYQAPGDESSVGVNINNKTRKHLLKGCIYNEHVYGFRIFLKF